jgi:ribosomal protein S18 acetylase RimI-like enzyme
MSPLIRDFVPTDLDAVVRLSLRAWEPVHVSIAEAFGPELNGALNPDWQASQERDVIEACTAPGNHVWVGVAGGSVVGFVAVRIHDDRRIGEIEMLAVDPDAQNHGLGTALTESALGWIREAGVPVAMVGTGADPGHAPARRTYEKAGLTLVPVARYFKKL